VATGRIAEAIVEPTKTNMINELVSQGAYYGMQTFDQHLVALVRDGIVTVDDAAAVASKPHDLSVELRRLAWSPDAVRLCLRTPPPAR
jgi:twitching motility protein PilT